LNEDPPAISVSTAATSPGLQRLVHRCLEKNPEQRFQSASDLAFALEALSESGSSSGIAIQAPASRPLRKWITWSAGLAAALSLAAVAYLLLARQNKAPSLRVSDYEQITHDGHQKSLGGTDGSRLYFSQGHPSSIGRVAVSGGTIAPVPVDIPLPGLVDV